MYNSNGHCHICGEWGKLTYEHIPPKQALNNKPMKIYSDKKLIVNQFIHKTTDLKDLRYENHQQGAGRYALCSRCNNNTGSYYAPHYNEFVKAIAYHMQKQEDATTEYFIHVESTEMNCLAVFKQIISMFCSTSSSGVLQKEFKDFLLNKESIQFDSERWKIYLYVNAWLRYATSGLLTFLYEVPFEHESDHLSTICGHTNEIITYPLGMVLYDCYSSYLPRKIGFDITAMSSVRYDEKVTAILDIPYRNKPVFILDA